MITVEVPAVRKKPAITHEIIVSMDGEVIVSKEGDCFTHPFVSALTAEFRDEVVRGYPKEDIFCTWDGPSDDTDTPQYDFWNNIGSYLHNVINLTSWDDNGTDKVRIELDEDTNPDPGELFLLSGIKIDGSYRNKLCGMHEIIGTPDNDYKIDTDIVYDSSATYDISNGFYHEAYEYDSPDVRDILASPVITVGKNSEAVDPRDNSPSAIITQSGTFGSKLEYGGVTITGILEDGGTKYVDIVQTITNNSSSGISIEDAHLWAGWSGNDMLMIGRNLVPITIGSGSTINITYRIKTSFETDGGFVRNLLKNLVGRFKNQGNDQTTVNGNSWIQDDGFAAGIRTRASSGYEDRGLIVGGGTTQPTFDDISMDSKIPHGEGSGKLFYYGSFMENIEIDEANGFTSVDVVRIFENRSGSSIDINEVGLLGEAGWYDRNDSDTTEWRSCLQSRNILPSTETVPNGELLKLVYKIKVPT